MKNPLKVWTVVGTTLVFAVVLTFWTMSRSESKPVIAIVTTLSHPALDSVRQGFIDGMAAEKERITFVDYNAEGNLQQANLIAHQIAQNPNVIGILAIGTLAAQTMAKAEKRRPIVIAAVSDPRVILPEGSQNNICGLSDSIDADYQIDTIRRLFPALKRLALLYSPHEANSASMVNNLRKSAEDRQLAVELVGVQDAQQIMMASLMACKNADAVLIPLDNQLVAAMPSVIRATKDLPCPIITSNESPIHQGATLAFGVNYKTSGQKASEILQQILRDAQKPEALGYSNPDSIDLFINDKVAKEKGIAVPEQASGTIIRVGGEI